MTEDEAKKKFCCAPLLPAITNEMAEPIVASLKPGEHVELIQHRRPLCIGSHCMAWRYHTGKDSGYCGLAAHRE